MATNIQSKKWTIQDIGRALEIHFVQAEERDRKIKEMYKILVTGNGMP